jgi:16S rRNA (uracil1498-N3)-methyltransferase
MPQFFVTPETLTHPQISIRGKEARHLRDVLRLDVGDWVVLCDGEGQRYRAEITESRPLHVTLRRGEALPALQLPAHITIAAAVIRPQRFEWMVEKIFELGCRRLIPMTTERTVAHYIKDAHKQHVRWSEIALSAAKQSGLPWLPEVAPVTSLGDFVKTTKGQLVYCWEGLALDDRHPGQRAGVQTWMPAQGRHDEVTIVIGPEGGFSAQEHDMIMAQDPKLLSLGPLILRSETAALTALIKVTQ